MAALLLYLGELVTFVSRILFLIKDVWQILKWNLLFLFRIAKDFFPWLLDMGKWLFEYIAHFPGMLAEGTLLQFAKWINLALASSCCGFIVDAVSFSQVVQGIEGLSYFAGPWRLGYAIGVILCALMIRFFLKWVPHIPVPRLPRLPGVNWPKLPGGGS